MLITPQVYNQQNTDLKTTDQNTGVYNIVKGKKEWTGNF